jgi:urease accessory protein
MRPFYEKKDFMTVMLLTASAGIMAGDRQQFDIQVKSNAKMEFVSQAYEKIHKMQEGFATKTTFIKVEKDAELHYAPLPTIPFTDSSYKNRIEVELEDDTSKFVMYEVLSAGRIGYGESFGYRLYQNQIFIKKNGHWIYRDNTKYEPSKTDMFSFGMYESFTHLGNLVLCNYNKDDKWLLEIREFMDGFEDLECGISRLASGDLVIRVFAMSAEKISNLLKEIVDKI